MSAEASFSKNQAAYIANIRPRVIMPQGVKIKLSSRGNRHQAQFCRSAPERADAPEKFNPSIKILHADAGLASIPKMPKRAVLLNPTTVVVSWSQSESSSDESDEFESFYEDIAYNNIHQEILGRKVVMLLQILLNNYNMKQLTTMEDMLKVLDRKEMNSFPEILRKASEKLADVFAVELREVESNRQAYNLISKLKLPNNGRVRAGKGLPKTGFLMSILALIFLHGNSISEEHIWKILKAMEVYPGKKHQVYGEPRKLLTHYLVRLKYLEYRQVADSDPPHYEFLWGPQAHAETSKMQVLKFLAKATEASPSSFGNLYEEALKDEEERGSKMSKMRLKDEQERDTANLGNAANADVIPMPVCPLMLSPLLKCDGFFHQENVVAQ